MGERPQSRHQSIPMYSKDPGSCSEYEPTWDLCSEGKLNQPSVGNSPNQSQGHAPPRPPHGWPLLRVKGSYHHLQGQGSWPSLLGRHEGAQNKPWPQEGSPQLYLLPPLVSLQTGVSENGFYNSVSDNQLFTTLLPTNS